MGYRRARIMEIKHEKFKEELSKFYKMGYATHFRDAVTFLKKIRDEMSNQLLKDTLDETIDGLFTHYNSYPCITPEIPDENK